MALIAVPVTDQPFFFVVNLETGAWCKFTEWKGDAVAVLGDSLHFATGVNIRETYTTGLDGASPIVCKMCGPFTDFGVTDSKSMKRTRGVFKSSVSFTAQFSSATDYTENFPTAPNAATVSSVGGAVWDAADWDTSDWASYGLNKTTIDQWHITPGVGFAHAIQLQITSGDTVPLDCELVRYDVTYTVGDTG